MKLEKVIAHASSTFHWPCKQRENQNTGASEVEGYWVDARGMFLGEIHAGTVYRLLGKNDIGAKQFHRRNQL